VKTPDFEFGNLAFLLLKIEGAVEGRK
jgi:hypothetical protein